jgi:hypothetical protein
MIFYVFLHIKDLTIMLTLALFIESLLIKSLLTPFLQS